MSAYRIGAPIAYEFTCYNQLGAKFDPDVVMVSLVKDHSVESPSTSTIEDTLIYLGSDPRDSQLTRVSIGVYKFVYIADVVGRWSILPSWSDSDLLTGALVAARNPILIDVIASEHQFTDRPE